MADKTAVMLTMPGGAGAPADGGAGVVSLRDADIAILTLLVAQHAAQTLSWLAKAVDAADVEARLKKECADGKDTEELSEQTRKVNFMCFMYRRVLKLSNTKSVA